MTISLIRFGPTFSPTPIITLLLQLFLNVLLCHTFIYHLWDCYTPDWYFAFFDFYGFMYKLLLLLFLNFIVYDPQKIVFDHTFSPPLLLLYMFKGTNHESFSELRVIINVIVPVANLVHNDVVGRIWLLPSLWSHKERERERERFYLVIVYKIKELMNATCYTCCGLPTPFSNSGDLVAVLYVISSTPSIGVE